MAAFDHIKDLNDIALKPRLLQSLLVEQVPKDDNLPLRDPSVLSSIVSILKTHQLLAEQSPPSSDAWNSAVNAWVRRIVSLAQSNLPDKRWVGVCLLGVTCTECSSARFLSSYSDWFNVFLSQIQPSGASQFVRVASCAAMSDLLTRLGGFTSLKKDGHSLAGKLVLPILKMFDEDVPETVLEVAAQLLLTILNYFPSSVLRHLDNAEGVIVSKIMFANCSANLLEKLSCCLASLPKSRGDEDSWSLMMQKILLSLSALLNNVLEGVEEETRRGEAVALLVPPGKDPPPFLGGKMMTGVALSTEERSQNSRIASITSLMQCCCIMLTKFYPVQVEVPVSPLVAMIRRVLMVSGSLPDALQPFTTAMQQEFVCLQLPVLHLNGLEVLAAVVKGLRSQLLPHAADITWLLMKYFKTCWLPELRSKVYSIIRSLLISMGAGIACYIAEEVIDTGSADLKFADSTYDGAPLDGKSCVELSLQHHRKKRKHGAITGLSEEQQTSLCTELKERQASVALKIAAIETLEALLVMGGALKCDSWRRRIDDLMIEVATNACKGGWIHCETPFHCKETKEVTWEDFQLVALRALLASLLSPAGYRSPYLSKSFDLFHQGKQNTGTKVAEYCAQALLALEVLIHPRALPLTLMPLPNENNYSLGNTPFGDPKQIFPHTDGISRTGRNNSHDVYDFLKDVYMEDIPESFPAGDTSKDTQFDGKMLAISQNRKNEELNTMSTSENVFTKESDKCLEPATFDDKIESSEQHEEEPNRTHPSILPMRSPLCAMKGLENNRSDANESILSGASGSGQSGPAAGSIVSTSGPKVEITPDVDKKSTWKISMNDDDDSSDLFPDIVDADPDPNADSDSNSEKNS